MRSSNSAIYVAAHKSGCEQPTKFELVVNTKTAKSLGLNLSPSMLMRAEEVID